jgi:HSP90 family molecular chaperone
LNSLNENSVIRFADNGTGMSEDEIENDYPQNVPSGQNVGRI